MAIWMSEEALTVFIMVMILGEMSKTVEGKQRGYQLC